MNRTYGTRVQFENVTDYELTESFPNLSLQQLYEPYFSGSLYLDIHPVKEAQRLIEHLALTDELFVATAGVVGTPTEALLWYYSYHGEMELPTKCTDYMIQFLHQHYPQIELPNIVICAKKYLVDGDVLIDDNPEHLIAFNGSKILLDKPYNRAFDALQHGMLRAKNYNDIAHYIEMIREERYEL